MAIETAKSSKKAASPSTPVTPSKPTSLLDIVLHVGNSEWTGWYEAMVTRSMESLSGEFTLQIYDRWPTGIGSLKSQISEYSACYLTINGVKIMDGYVYFLSYEEEGQYKRLTIKGRDKTADLIDCSIIGISQMSSVSFQTIINTICKPFGIPLQFIGSTPTSHTFNHYTPIPGNSVASEIHRLSACQSILPFTNEDGQLIFLAKGQRSPNARFAGSDSQILSTFTENTSHRQWSEIHVWGQQPSGQSLEGSAEDSELRYRPLALMAEADVTSTLLNDRAKWELMGTAGLSRRIIVTRSGWLDSAYYPWRIHRALSLKNEISDTEELYIAAEVTFILSGGTDRRTQIAYIPASTYDI